MPWLVQILLSAFLGVVIAIGAWSLGGSRLALAPTETVPALIQPTATTTEPVFSETKKLTNQPSAPEEKPVPKTPAKVSAPDPQTAANTTPPKPIDTAPIPQSTTDIVRGAVVNIICTTQTSGPFSSISGSGVFIDSRGVILTNSHIAQYFLLRDYPTPGFVSCIIRTGNPAYPRYTADLLFMPPSWMAKNAQKINQSDPTGNGEHDYALLRVTGTTGPGVQMPAVFPNLAISTDPPAEKQNVLLAAYPAGFLGGVTVSQSLYQSSAEATVGALYTFVADTLDLFSIGGTVVSQKGSSGGAVADRNGNLLGLIVTATESPDTASRDLRAISTPYIIRDFAKEAGVSLPAFLAGDIAQEEQQFSLVTAPLLRAQLVNAIEQQ